MKNTNFSNLVFRIIGKPEAWHHEYLDVMHKVLDEAESIDDPDNISELEFGDQIINRLRESNDTLAAFNSLLDKSRFKIIILDEDYHPIYHNTNAQTLIKKLSNANNKQLDPILLRQLKNAPLANEENSQNSLQTIHFPGNSNEQLYFRSISSKLDESSPTRIFHLLLMLDQNQQHNDLNPDLVSKFELTEKEQLVLKSLIHGKSIKEIAIEAFISENTVKTHIKSLFRKTNTNSQAAIVGLILTHESQILDSYFDTGSPTIDLNNRDDKEIKLSDGHSIVYREYGPKEGRPLIVFHNGYGCRLTIPNNYREICETTDRRIIIPDRPGVGKTPYIRNHPHGWPERMNEFVEQLGLSEFDILGNVIGSHIAIDFAMKADDRLKHIILSSPVVVNHKQDIKLLSGILSPVSRLVKASPAFAREVYELWLKSVSLNLDKHYRSMLESTIGSAEKELFNKEGTIDSIVEGFQEAARHSFEGISHELVYCMTPLQADLSKIKAKVSIWYGTEDSRISLEGAQSLKTSLNDCTLHVKEGYSEHLYYAFFEEMIG